MTRLPGRLTDEPIVSVILAAFNAADCLRDAIMSVQAQTVGCWELIVVDDASTDATLALARGWAEDDPRIQVVALDRNAGPAGARNAALTLARGEWIAILDADDEFLPDRLEKLLYHAARRDLDFIADNILMRDPVTRLILRAALDGGQRDRKLTTLNLFQSDLPASGFVFGLLKPMIRRSFLLSKGLQYRQEFRIGEDFLFYAELLLNGARAAIIPAPYYIYNLPQSESTGQRSGFSKTIMDTAALAAIGDRLIARYGHALSKREHAALLRRAKYIKHVAAGAMLKQAIFDKDTRGAVGIILHDPFTLLFIYRGLLWRIRSKMSGSRRFPVDGVC